MGGCLYRAVAHRGWVWRLSWPYPSDVDVNDHAYRTLASMSSWPIYRTLLSTLTSTLTDVNVNVCFAERRWLHRRQTLGFGACTSVAAENSSSPRSHGRLHRRLREVADPYASVYVCLSACRAADRRLHRCLTCRLGHLCKRLKRWMPADVHLQITDAVGRLLTLADGHGVVVNGHKLASN